LDDRVSIRAHVPLHTSKSSTLIVHTLQGHATVPLDQAKFVRVYVMAVRNQGYGVPLSPTHSLRSEEKRGPTRLRPRVGLRLRPTSLESREGAEAATDGRLLCSALCSMIMLAAACRWGTREEHRSTRLEQAARMREEHASRMPHTTRRSTRNIRRPRVLEKSGRSRIDDQSIRAPSIKQSTYSSPACPSVHRLRVRLFIACLSACSSPACPPVNRPPKMYTMTRIR
jgi:hypothetical protein